MLAAIMIPGELQHLLPLVSCILLQELETYSQNYLKVNLGLATVNELPPGDYTLNLTVTSFLGTSSTAEHAFRRELEWDFRTGKFSGRLFCGRRKAINMQTAKQHVR
eukprot:1159765-Pelagomonas_calceolata.AAC.17